MPEISASEYLNSLLVSYQNAEKVYSQAVSDLVAAEIRRDEAKQAKDEAFDRLEEARGRYGADNQDQNQSQTSSPRGNPPPKMSADSFKKKGVAKNHSFQKKGPGRTNSFRKGNANTSVAPPPPPVPSTPNLGSKKAPKIFSKSSASQDGAAPKRKPSNIAAGPFQPLPAPTSVLEICKGRSRDWFDSNFDCESVGLVRKFYQASFGTKTHEKTKKVSVFTIVLNDDWNDLVSNTSEVQEMYIGKNPSPNGKPNLRDRAAEALVKPPQREPVALFFAPKNSRGTSDIFYGGHWKVVDGKMLVPPRAVKGQDRQCLA
eukprot:CAMPEP_0117033486 /NCGR_PEP_ID=MMETSP0472-20121206/23919_1 /TAXON_ID=693140 ORGANISM="Tiarina fusus, Strain LIS" /NCGR_SAMPLE_ID=MMETSP0472 /ASSEMBLY_ACC=CAM_ASM_000603 /LENGTH=315 /DNA_ID=CAMNT_0004742409 /DNA_START=56 /DNA_END=999 /DNA_ORIENTATION=-